MNAYVLNNILVVDDEMRLILLVDLKRVEIFLLLPSFLITL